MLTSKQMFTYDASTANVLAWLTESERNKKWTLYFEWTYNSMSYAIEFLPALIILKAVLLGIHWAWKSTGILSGFWSSGSGGILHFSQAARRCWCCWSEDFTWFQCSIIVGCTLESPGKLEKLLILVSTPEVFGFHWCVKKMGHWGFYCSPGGCSI